MDNEGSENESSLELHELCPSLKTGANWKMMEQFVCKILSSGLRLGSPQLYTFPHM